MYPEVQTQEDLFHSRVQFQGKSVLEGIRNLAAAGYATMPLQKHLTCIPSRARNCFLLARKQQTSDASQQRKQTLSEPLSERVENRTATSSPQRVGSRTATLQSPQRVGNRTATLQSPQRAGNRTAALPSPQRSSKRATPLTSQRVSNRTAQLQSPQQRAVTKQQTVKETWNTPEKRNKAAEKQRQKKKTDINKKVLKENQSLNSSVDSDKLSVVEGKKSNTGLRERSKVHHNISSRNLVPKQLKRKTER